MPTILGAAASGMTHNQLSLDIIGHNVANANSFAYKKLRPLHEGLPTPGVDPEGGRLGVAQTTSDLILSQASTFVDEDPMHFAIEDDAFMRIQDYDGEVLYTRLGGLETDVNGSVLAVGARQLEPNIQLPELWTQPTVDPDGTVTALDLEGQRQVIGQLSFAKFRNPQGLEALGSGLYAETANTGEITVGTPASEGFAALRAGALEGSNVDIAEEFTNLIIAQRAYTACAKTFSVGDQMLELATRITQ